MKTYGKEILQEKPFSTLWAAWSAAREKGELIPPRTALRLQDLAAITSDLAVLQSGGDGEFYFQLQGQDMADRIQRTAKDEAISDLMAPSARDTTNKILADIIDTPQGGLVIFDAHYTSGKHCIVGVLYLPVLDQTGMVRKLIGVYHPLEILGYKAPIAKTRSGGELLISHPIDITP
ncbi:hypothetical protein GCM10017044_06580 [Kordiimonas sediminis]|uniref:PAS domain-containing protein n=1 Tax=Kordiimonas sediminis TaxID=1735581 RepID=A0A919E5Q9_9PROT|nr:PAS domain-containing protein [Kordiimonas sediminis]GHF15121.1 hypothetical protein GCM10017044_06580 [Kordiimonas sediminis]